MTATEQSDSLSEISQIIDLNHPLSAYKSIVFCDAGVIALNGTTGILYKRDHLPVVYRSLIDKSDGPFAVEDAPLFYRVNNLIKNAKSVVVELSDGDDEVAQDVVVGNKSVPAIQVSINDGPSEIKLRLPIATDITSEFMPQLNVEWPDYENENSEKTTIRAEAFMDNFNDVKDHIVSTKDDVLAGWDAMMGAYCTDNKLYSFTKTLVLLGNEHVDIPNFYCPLKFVNLVTPKLHEDDTLYIDDSDQLFLNTQTKIYTTKFKKQSHHFDRIKGFFESGKGAERIDVNLLSREELNENLFRVEKALSMPNSDHVLKIIDKQLMLYTNVWQGLLGEIDHPDNEFPFINFHSLRKWAEGTDQSMLLFPDNIYQLRWISKTGLMGLSNLNTASVNVKLNNTLKVSGDGEDLL